MQALARPFLIALLAWPILAGCTRERPTPEPTATAAIIAGATAAPAAAMPTTAMSTTAISTTAGPTAAPASSTPSAETGLVVGTPADTPAATPSPTSQQTFLYVVQPGDTLSAISLRFGTTLDVLGQLNNLSGDNLIVGQPIYVPYIEGMTAEGMPTPTPGPFYYTVQPGDTLSGISLRFGVDPLAIIEANRATLLDPNNLGVGATLLIPDYQPPAANGEATAAGTPSAADDGAATTTTTIANVTHVVQPGQSLSSISQLYGVAVAEIAAANGLTDQNVLRVGQELIIPGITMRDAAAAQGSLHSVRAGESLLSIALQYGITVDDILAVNELDNPDAIFIGQELIIPRP